MLAGMTSDTIPTVDLTAFDSEGPDRDAAARDIARAFGDFGLVYLTGHGVQQDQVGHLYDAFGAFTKRSDAEKEKLSTGHIWYQRGWTPPNTEKAVVAGGQPDFKECFFAAPEETDAALRTQYPEIFADNVWPDDSGPLRRALHGGRPSAARSRREAARGMRARARARRQRAEATSAGRPRT